MLWGRRYLNNIFKIAMHLTVKYRDSNYYFFLKRIIHQKNNLIKFCITLCPDIIQNDLVYFFLLRNIVIQQMHRYCFIQWPLCQTERNSSLYCHWAQTNSCFYWPYKLCIQLYFHLNKVFCGLKNKLNKKPLTHKKTGLK